MHCVVCNNILSEIKSSNIIVYVFAINVDRSKTKQNLIQGGKTEYYIHLNITRRGLSRDLLHEFRRVLANMEEDLEKTDTVKRPKFAILYGENIFFSKIFLGEPP